VNIKRLLFNKEVAILAVLKTFCLVITACAARPLLLIFQHLITQKLALTNLNGNHKEKGSSQKVLFFEK